MSSGKCRPSSIDLNMLMAFSGDKSVSIATSRSVMIFYGIIVIINWAYFMAYTEIPQV